MDSSKCVVCSCVPDSSDPCTVLLQGLTEHTGTPLREVVGPALQQSLTSADIICARCLQLFNEKDRLLKLTTDMDSHIQTKILKGSAPGNAAVTGAIEVVVGSSPGRHGIKDQLERQYRTMRAAAAAAAAAAAPATDTHTPSGGKKKEATMGGRVMKRRRGRPPKPPPSGARWGRGSREAQQPPPLMVNQREKRKRSAKFSTFLEVLKGEKEFYIEDEGTEEPRRKRQGTGRQRKGPGMDVVKVVHGGEEEEEEEEQDGTCVIQVTDVGLPLPPQRERLDLDEVVEEILGLRNNPSAPLIPMEGLASPRGTQEEEEEEEDLISAISKMSAEVEVEAEATMEGSREVLHPSIRLESQGVEAGKEMEEYREEEEWMGREQQEGAGGGVVPPERLSHGSAAPAFIEVTEAKEDMAAGVEVVLSHDGAADTLHATISNPTTPPPPATPPTTTATTTTPTTTFEVNVRADHEVLGVSAATATPSTKKYRCKVCATTFPGREEAQQHAQECHGAMVPPAGTQQQESFQCSECERWFPTARGRDRHHLHMHLKHQPVHCPHCSATFNSFRPLERHLRVAHDRDPTLYCETCDAEFVLGTSLEHHREIVHPSVPGRAKAARARAAPSQRPREQQKQSRVFRCPLCGEELVGAKALRLHHQKKHDGCEYTCNYCAFKSACFSSLNRHMVRVHRAFDMKLHTCSTCPARYSTPQDLEEHYVCMHGARPSLLCQHCGHKFACMDMLRFHRNTHRAFQCHLCHLGFMKEEALEEHVKTVHSCDPAGGTDSGGSAKSRVSDGGVPGEPKGGQEQQGVGEGAALDPKVLVITSDGSVQVKEEKKDVEGEPSGDVTLHLQQSREGGLEEMDMLNPLKGQRVKDLPKKMSCPVCNKVLTTKFLRTHMLSHQGSLPHKCRLCDKAYAQGTLLRKHMKNRHYEEFLKMGNKNPKKHKVSCDFCQEIFSSIYHLEEHLWMHMTEKNFECSDCKIKFGMESNLREHYKSHYFKEAKPCPVCQREFKSIGFYNDHVERCRRGWKCEHCGVDCDTQEYYRKHQRAEHGGENVVRYQCSMCEKSFVERHRYDDHVITHSSEKAFTCHICMKQFKRQRPLNDHLLRSHSSGLFVCSHCHQTFQRQQDLDSHKLLHCLEFPCGSCSRTYSSKETMLNHVAVHHSEATLACHVCSEPFTRQVHLKTHLVTHSSGTPHICQADRCHKMFRSESLLRNHAARRHGDLHYDCSHCDRKFSLEADQISHAATHSGASSLGCEECGRTFRSEAVLERHLLTHTQEKPYECEVCQHSASTRQQVLRHLQAVHGLSEGSSHVVVNRWRCSTCSKMFVAQPSILRHLQEHAGQGVEAQGHAIKTRLVPSSTLELSLPVGSLDPAAATASFLDQVSSLSWQDLTRLLRFHIMSDNENDGGNGTPEGTDVWQCPGCLHATHAEDDMRDHLLGSSECQEAVILYLARGLTTLEEEEDLPGSAEEHLMGSDGSTVVQLATADGGVQYIIVKEEDSDSTPQRLSELAKAGQGEQEGGAEGEGEGEGEGEEAMQVLVSMDDSLQQLLHQQPDNPNIQIIMEDSTPLKQFLVESTEGQINTTATDPPPPTQQQQTATPHDTLPADAPLLNGSEVLLQTADGKLLLQQTVGGVTQYQLVEGIPTTPMEDAAPNLLPDHAATLDEGFIIPS